MTIQEIKRFKCDQCGMTTETHCRGPKPMGWLALNEYKHLCSWGCLAKWAERQEQAEKEQAARQNEKCPWLDHYEEKR